ncbi:hypothetical protein [Colwellia psychrerythraea]|uniref:Uncharacterized protein n=1 Tax=Colwellia psychrerythraea TaxID=28229 RepID=A0A099KTC0_COLPS|nr:hypothetical protein [Colwellia psychrerythraea]KGJ93786.1 hypothetical protein GAB14E_2341 [Colwellia psychrerythraea]
MKAILILLLLFSSNLFAEEIAIDVVKTHPEIIDFLSNKPATQYWIKFSQMSLGSECGFAGCQWRKLVSLVVTSKKSNAPSITTLALVSGQNSSNTDSTNVEFVELTKLTAKSIQSK